MNILKWVLVIVVAYVARYFSHFPDADPVSGQVSSVSEVCPQSMSASDDVDKGLQHDRERSQRLEKTKQEAKANSSQSKAQEKIVEQPVPDSYPKEKMGAPFPLTGAGFDPKDFPPVEESNITNEEIDKLVAAPFNETLKRTRGPLREKYKDFAEATEQNDWDINTQNRMTDVLLGNQYSKFIELESLICRADYCEIRGRELKPNVFGLIMSEMMLQDWWKMGHSQWTNGMEDGTFYALIAKAPEQ